MGVLRVGAGPFDDFFDGDFPISAHSVPPVCGSTNTQKVNPLWLSLSEESLKIFKRRSCFVSVPRRPHRERSDEVIRADCLRNRVIKLLKSHV